jgi:CHAT domain-containing protein/Tfp pilus assembly protein PilF
MFLVHLLIVAALTNTAAQPGSAQQAATSGIVVQAVQPTSAGERAGLKPGDELTSWERASSPDGAKSRGNIKCPFDLTEIETEQAPRGVVTLVGLRDGKELRVSVPAGRWGTITRPAMAGDAVGKYETGVAAMADGRVDDTLAAWRMAADHAKSDEIAAWLKLQEANALRDAGRADAAHAAIREALEVATRSGDRGAIAGLYEAQGQLYERQRDAAGAEQSYRAAIAARQGSGPAGLGTARGLVDLAFVSIGQGDFEAAEGHVRKAVEIQEQLAPASFILARSLATLGGIRKERGDLDAAMPLVRRATDLLERLVPNTADHAGALNNLGTIRWGRGELVEATRIFERVIEIYERLDASGPQVAATLSNLGAVIATRGRLLEGERLYRRALAIYQERQPGSADEASALDNLAQLLAKRGDLASAETYHLRALAIRERVTPNSRALATTLHNMGVLSSQRGDPARAEDYYRRSLEIEQRLAPDSLDVAARLNNLGAVAAERGDFAAAEKLLRQALAIKERLAPRTPIVASTLSNLGDLAESRNDPTSARELYDKARVILEQVSPDSVDLSTVLGNLADIATRTGERAEAERLAMRAVEIAERVAPESEILASALRRIGLQAFERKQYDRAAQYFARSIEALEAQTSRLGGSSHVRTGFVGQHHDYYSQYIDTLIAVGQSVRAFEVLERSRARGFRMMLAERDLALDADLTPDLAESIRALGEEYDSTQEALTGLDPGRDAGEVERLRRKLRDLTESRARLADQVRAASPRLAALRYESPLDLSAIQRALDPGTVLLSYQIGRDVSRLFVTAADQDGRAQFAVHTLAVGEGALRDQVAQLGRQIERQRSSGDVAPAFVDLSRQLFELLIGPAQEAIAAADRLLIVPDGPLHSLPFGALVRPGVKSTTRPWQYVVEWKPLHTVLSATVYAELRKRRTADTPPNTLIAFGDPNYPPPVDGSKGTASETEHLLRGPALAPLPETRAEVEALARTFGAGATTYLGSEATEERAKAVKQSRYIHFATHGILDARSPLDSALALTVPAEREDGQENGLLQAWEIFEQLRIDADLVTLSACETALGQELAGEGLIGLTRAFHYVGAKSVVGSLWQVADASTANMMTKFYSHLRAGISKDEALRQAQRDMIADPKTAAPFHWAAFILSGDWR